jgi:prolyl 4-hydroxylase
MVYITFFIIIIIISVLFIWFKNSRKKIPKTKGFTEKTTFHGRDIIKHTYGDFKIWEVYNILSEEECKKIIQLATMQGFYTSPVGEKERIDYRVRSSQVCWLENKKDHVVANLANTAASFSGYPIENQEMLQVAKYGPGGKFGPHYDPCLNSEEVCYTTNRGAGHRVASLLMYLNDDFEGGETYFGMISLVIKPERGKGVLFWSMDDENEAYPESMHEGLPVRSRLKYICTKWSHPRKYPVDHGSA